MSFNVNLLLIVCCLASVPYSDECTMEGVSVWQLPIELVIEDYYEGVVLQRGISNILDYTVVSYEELNGGPYMDISIENSEFVIRTNEAYRLYEENETHDEIHLTFTFRCTGGTTSLPLNVRIAVNDNNNNNPLFKTATTAASHDTTYEFTIVPPVPPGFLITDCISDIIVRDIDLTNYRIDFGIEENPYVEIAYDEAASTLAKEYKATLRTTSLIRSLPEPIVLTISATDVDQTGDPPITTYTNVTIYGSSEFELPAEPVFSQTYYTANYDENNQVSLEQPISLQQGYDNQVQFNLEGGYASNFILVDNNNQVSLSVANLLPPEALREGQLYLVLNAVRADTSGASATIIVQLPEAVNLEFERPHYEGQIVDNTLQLTQLTLSQGYQDSTISAIVEDYPSFFTASVVGNVISLSMTPLDAAVIEENNFINLRVTAVSEYSSATTIVTLEVIKEDTVTPVFEKPLYTGTYDSSAGLTLEPLILVQGYEDTVQITFTGEYEDYFELDRSGASSTLRVVGTGLPSHILSDRNILLSVAATKPRTVGSTAVVSIALPEARELQFEAPSYSGSLQDNVLTLETIVLNVGYNEDVIFSLGGDYESLFSTSTVQNQVTINLLQQLPQEVISEHNFLTLTVVAAGVNALSTTTAVVLEIIKDDVTTPVFSQSIYYGNYLGPNIEIGNINLIQGYDSSVTFRIEGENTEYFEILYDPENNVTLNIRTSIPEEVIFNEKVFVFNIVADKPLTVGANTAISIKFPTELTEPTLMRFSNNTYSGSVEDDVLSVESIILDTGFSGGTEFILTGEYATSFAITSTNNVVSLSLLSALPTEVFENNKFILLELEARRERAVSVSASIIIDLVEEEITIPVFNQAFYTGVYTAENTLQFQDTVTLLQGYDDTVEFGVEGELSTWFTLVQNGNSINLVSLTNVPQEVLDRYHQLLFTVVANKPNSIRGEAAISIDLPKDVLEQEVLRFAQSSYEGQINGSDLEIPTIIMINEFTEYIQFELTGAHAAYFTISHELNTVYVELSNNLPSEVLSDNEFLVLGITASKVDAISGYTTLVLSIVKEPRIVTPVFEQAYYTGEYSNQSGLIFEQAIRLAQGFDETVTFTLQGDGNEWFTLTQNENSLSLSIAEGGIQEIENVNHLIFSISAIKPGSVTGQAAIVIHLTDLPTSRYLRFSQNHYRGAIEEGVLIAENISLEEGYATNVLVTLIGDYEEYFTLLDQGGTYILQLTRNIPEDFIEANNLLIITVEANVDNAWTHATIVIELVTDTITNQLVFDETYYVASYSATTGTIAEDVLIRVVSGYEENVTFTLQGDATEWFTIERNNLDSTIITIGLYGPIPIELFVNNQPLILIFEAIRPDGNTARATIVITLDGDSSDIIFLGFEHTSYIGTIENNIANLEPIVLDQGFSEEVYFELHTDLSKFFTLTQQGATITVELQRAIPEELIPANRIIVLEIRATAPQAVSAVTTLVFNVVQEDNATQEELTFSAPFYTGQFSETGGLVFETVISLDEGYDENVEFALEGDHAQWFTLVVQGNSVSLSTSGAIPPAILANNQQLVFLVTAQKPNSNTARATVVISIEDDYTDAVFLGFEQANYLGTIESDVSTIDPIILNEGYTAAVTFSLHGDMSSFFTLTQQGAAVTVVLQRAIPEESIPANRIIVLEIRATAPQAVSAVTTLVFNVVQEDNATQEELTFSAPFYTGQFSEAGGLVFETVIFLDEGYDANVEFALEGDHAQWFALVVQGNSVSLSTSGAIPPAILANNQQLVFLVTAQKPNSNTARATVVISLEDDYTDAVFLGFEQANYLGTIESDVSTIDPIILNEGYTAAVTFSLHGDTSSFFTLTQQDAAVTVVLQRAIPEELIPANRIIVLEIRATAPQAVSAVTTLVFNIVQEDNATQEELTFSAPFYTGQFSEAGGLIFETVISLDEGYDANVEFALEGDHAQWFALVVQGNSVSLSTSGAIPPAILANNQQLVFLVTAQKPNSNTARATVVISLEDDYTDAVFLGFEQANYLGTIESDVSTIDPIILNEGYTAAVTFSLHGDMSSFFTLTQQGAAITVVLQRAIPEESIPANRIIVLEIRATAPQAVSAVTTLVFNVVQDDNATQEELTFSAPFYTGQFSEAGGLVFETVISLDEGYDANVEFALEGDHAQWFTLVVQGNSVSLSTSGAIPPAILANNQQLVFLVTAQKPNSNTARATVVISLEDDYTDAVFLGFEQANYLGTIESDVSTIDPIILNEGYTAAVTFSLHGDMSSFFTLTQQGAAVTVVLQRAIPEESIPANRIIVLEIRATAPQAVSAVTTLVFNVVQDDNATQEELTFSAPFYTGQFSEAGGLAFETVISLDEGYDANVEFALEGDHAQWFALVVQGNSVSLSTSGAIPPAILANNQQLVFLVTAQKPNSNTARATVVISLEDDYTDAVFLGFEQANYLGTIESDVSTIDPIILNEGYTAAVTFSLHGDMSSFFTLTQQGAAVTAVLLRAIPEESIPANRIIVLEIRATAPQAVSAVTTLVFNVVQEDNATQEELTFSAPFYTGQFSEAGGLVFETVISLDEGYDANVEFALEGDHAQWFTLVVQGNSVSLTTSGAIPPAILANNQQLVFLVTAQKPNSNTARATVVISLEDDYTDAVFLGFEQANYLGTIESDVSTIDPIILNEGYTAAVTFSLHGDMSSFFTLIQQGAAVTVVLQRAIPGELIPANRIIVLEIRATAPQAVSAVTTLVFNVVQEDNATQEELTFSAPFYTGQFSEAGGLVFETVISLDEGYDANVEFALEGDYAQWFTLVVQGNSVSLSTSGAIPPAILANNQQLVFLVTAQKPNSNTARATVVISLEDDYTDAVFLGFEQANYLGTIESDVSTIDPIILNEGYTAAVTFSLHGDMSSFFTLTQQGAAVTVVLQRAIPEELIPANRIIVLEIRATAPQAVSAVTTLVFNVVQEDNATQEELTFGAPFYTGQFSEAGGLVFETVISLDKGYDANVEFALEGDHAQWFTLVVQGNSVSLSSSGAIPPAILANNQQLVFLVTAQKPNSNTARATVVISLEDDYTDAVFLGFEQANYLGTIESDVSTIDPIILNEGYTAAVTFSLHGDMSSFFTLTQQGAAVTVVLQRAIPEESIPANRIIVLEIRATAPQAVSAVTTLVFNVVQKDNAFQEELTFSAPFYTGQFSEAGGLVFETVISLDEGYDANVEFALEGAFDQYFNLSVYENSVTLEMTEEIPSSLLIDTDKLIFVVTATKPNSNEARTVIIISILKDTSTEIDAAFDKVLYEGTIRLSEVQHEAITVTGFTVDSVDIVGDYGHLFSASVSEGAVVVVAAASLGLPDDVTHVPLELRASGASAVLLLNVLQSETPELPSVSFGSSSYVLRAEMSQTGVIGQVAAAASNEERITYTLAINDAHLLERVSVNDAGEIRLSAPTNTGVYSFQAIATSIITAVQATAEIQLTVDASGTCGEDEHVLPPLIILDRDEEEPHENLVVLDNATHSGCQLSLTNRWPLVQDWLYVDENGLHARSIDREDPRIAFMALSQVQVELILECDSDTTSRAKRSASTNPRLDWLGPYEYGSNQWILTDTILYNSRRSFVNLIVNDINDNYPIFVGKENEPIVVGYPIPELEEIVLPRALAELKATDADVGENAELVYWSDEGALAVAPRTGSVHVRDGVSLADGALLTVSATDRNGQDGLTSSIQLLVKLIDSRHIAVVTVRNAFLDQEGTILSNLTAAVGYEVKVLSSAVISDDTDADSANARNKRQVSSAEGATLQLYVYGVIDLEPVAVQQLNTDITENVLTGVDIASTVSLEDHLEGRAIPGSAGRDTGLLVATIVLSVLLFILIVAIAVWFFLRWRKARNYEEFSDANSLASRNEPLEEPPKGDNMKKPRLNIEELKRSERRLQEMLEAPIDEVTAKPSSTAVDPEGVFDTIINMAPPDTTMPIVIQSIDKLKDDANSGDEDEYGERKNKNRRKSVVTFNENVEKIIHVEDIPDDNSSDVEVFRF